MKDDPAKSVEVYAVPVPPRSGPGSGKEAWIAFAEEIRRAGRQWQDLCKEQSQVIADLQAEVRLLREHIASRKPKGGRPRLPDDKVAAIEVDLQDGASMRLVAKRHGVSVMTVSRIAQRAQERA